MSWTEHDDQVKVDVDGGEQTNNKVSVKSIQETHSLRPSNTGAGNNLDLFAIWPCTTKQRHLVVRRSSIRKYEESHMTLQLTKVCKPWAKKVLCGLD